MNKKYRCFLCDMKFTRTDRTINHVSFIQYVIDEDGKALGLSERTEEICRIILSTDERGISEYNCK